MKNYWHLLLCVVVSSVIHSPLGDTLLTTYHNKHYNIIYLERNLGACSDGASTLLVSAHKPTLIRLGHALDIHPANVTSCQLQLVAPAGSGISVTLRTMDLRLHRNQRTGEVTCHDHVTFTRPADSFLDRLLSRERTRLDGRSAKLCRVPCQMDCGRLELDAADSAASSLYAPVNRLNFHYERSGDSNHTFRELTVMVTAIKTTADSCPEWHVPCRGQSVPLCVPNGLQCHPHNSAGSHDTGDAPRDGDAGGGRARLTGPLVLMLIGLLLCLGAGFMRWLLDVRPDIVFAFFGYPGYSSVRDVVAASAVSELKQAEPAPCCAPPSYDSAVRGLDAPPAYNDLDLDEQAPAAPLKHASVDVETELPTAARGSAPVAQQAQAADVPDTECSGTSTRSASHRTGV